MSEWRDFLEGVELTERQKRIYDLACEIDEFSATPKQLGEELKHLLIEEFTGVRIV